PAWEEDMRAHDVPEWYINSCNKIKYMFPKAHAVAYCMMALRIAWFKVHHPEYFYAVYFSIRADAYEIDTMIAGEGAIYDRLLELESRKNAKGKDALSAKENNIYAVLEVAYEMYRRGYRFENISLEKSDSYRFIVNPEDHHSIIPPFTSIDGLGISVANSVVEARKQYPFISREDLTQRTSLSGTHMDILDRMGVLKGLQDTNQLSLF
ncbi:MAG: PolC-type DNA polymerase III, partial [Erysipelotrichales bacterium]|nr:PolC-type DNA polymerase III [Erysipelotrichales bacterium]